MVSELLCFYLTLSLDISSLLIDGQVPSQMYISVLDSSLWHVADMDVEEVVEAYPDP